MRHVVRITCQPGRELLLARQVAAARIPSPGRVHGQVWDRFAALPCGWLPPGYVLPGSGVTPGDPPIDPPPPPPPGTVPDSLNFALADNSMYLCLLGGI